MYVYIFGYNKLFTLFYFSNQFFIYIYMNFQVHYNSKTHSSDQEMKSKSSADSFEGEEPGRRKSPTPEPSPGSSPLAEESSNYKTSWPPPDFPKVIVKIDEEQEEVMMRRKFSPPLPRVPPRPQPPFSLESIESRESTSSAPSKKSGVKKANLYAWLSLQSLPEVGLSFMNQQVHVLYHVMCTKYMYLVN